MDLKEIQEKVNIKRENNDLIVISTELRKASISSDRKTRFITVIFKDDSEKTKYELSFKHVSKTNPRKGKQHRVKKYTKNEFNKLLNKIKPEKIELIGEYMGKHTKTLFKNFNCGHEFYMTPNDIHRNNTVCPICSKKNSISYGEKLIHDYLNENNIKYIAEKIFPDLKFKKNLRIDFFLPENNIAIEFQGKQHFLNTDSFYRDSEGYEKIKNRDEIKKKYCEEKNIQLIYLNYKMIKNGVLTKEAINILDCKIKNKI